MGRYPCANDALMLAENEMMRAEHQKAKACTNGKQQDPGLTQSTAFRHRLLDVRNLDVEPSRSDSRLEIARTYNDNRAATDSADPFINPLSR
jgi:hypothetical protein